MTGQVTINKLCCKYTEILGKSEHGDSITQEPRMENMIKINTERSGSKEEY